MIDTTGRLIAAFSFIAFALNIPPFCYHWGRKNIPACSLFFWLMYNTLVSFINALIWSGSDFYDAGDAPGYCDITVRISSGSSSGIICAIACLMMNLYLIIDARHSNFLETKSKRRTWINVAICWATPVCIMGTSVIVQSVRYVILRYRGCVAAYGMNWVSLVLVSIWPLVWTVVAVIFAALTVWTYLKKRRDIKDILRCTNSGLTMKRYARLLIFSFLIMFVMCPFAIYTFIDNLESFGLSSFSWSETHSQMWSYIFKEDAGATQLASQIIDIVISVVAFLLFGVGSDAVALYCRFLGRIGFKRFSTSHVDDVVMANTFTGDRNASRQTGQTGDSEKTMETLMMEEFDLKELLFDEPSVHLARTLSNSDVACETVDNSILELQLGAGSADQDIQFDFSVKRH